MGFQTFDSLPAGAQAATSIPDSFIAAAVAAIRGIWTVEDGAAVLTQARVVHDDELVYEDRTKCGDASYKARRKLAKALDLDPSAVKTANRADDQGVYRFWLALADGVTVEAPPQPEDLLPPKPKGRKPASK